MKKIQKVTTANFFIKYRFYLAFALIVLLAGFLRLYKLGQVPVSLYWDEAAMLVDAKSIAQTGRDMHGNFWLQAIFPSYGDYKLPVYIWLASLSVKLFGVSEFSLRLPSALIGITQVVLIGVAAQNMFIEVKRKRMLALIAMGILAISPWAILFSRTGFEGHVGQFLLMCSMLCIVMSQVKNSSIKQTFSLKQLIWLGAGVLLGAIAVYAYYSVRFVWPVVMIAYFVLLAPKQLITISLNHFRFSIQHKQLLTVFFTVIVWLVLLLPLSKSPHYADSQTFRLSTDSILKNETEILQSNVYRELAGNGSLSRIFYHRHWLTLRELMKNYAAHIDPTYLFMTGDVNLRHGTNRVGLFQFWMLPVFAIGLYSIAKRNWRVLLYVSIWWMIALLPASVPTSVPHALRSLNALTPLVIIVSMGAFALTQKILNWPVQLKQFGIGTLMIVAGVGTLLFVHDYFQHYPQRSAYDWQDGYRQLSQLIEAEKSPVRTVWVNPDDSRLYLWLMIYGSYTGRDFQSWPSEGYQFQTISNVVFEPFDWLKLDSLDHKLIVVEKPGMLQGEPNRVEQIRDASGKVRFEVGWYGR